MGIVLPDGDLTNQNTEFVRAWLKDRAQIEAVISLPQETFVPFGAGVKSSILFLKKPKGELPKRYPIFFVNLEKIGYDIRGRKTYKRNENGEVIDNEGHPTEYLTDRRGNRTKQDPVLIELKGALDTDTPKVLLEWEKFQKGLFQEVGKNVEDKIFIRWNDEIDFVARLDVNFWLLISSKIKGVKLSEIATIQTGKQYEFYENSQDAVPYVSIKDFENLFVEDTDRFVLRDAIVNKTRIGKGDILLAVTGATIGKVGIFMGDEGVVSADVAIIRPTKMNPYFLATLLQSEYGKRIVSRYTYGATNKHLDIKGFVENFIVPELNTNEINLVSRLAEEAVIERVKSKQKLQEAQDFVENSIKGR